MPEDCRWRIAEDQDALWNMDRVLIALLVNQMQGYIWANADKKKRGPKPKPIGPNGSSRPITRESSRLCR